VEGTRESWLAQVRLVLSDDDHEQVELDSDKYVDNSGGSEPGAERFSTGAWVAAV
jgi:hypothetical protein